MKKTTSPPNIIIVIIGFYIFLISSISAQQLPVSLQGRDNISILNPAAIGNEYFFHERKSGFQLTSLNYPALSELSPKTGLLHGYTIIGNKDLATKILVGVNLMFDDEGFTQTLSPQIRVAGIIPIDSERQRIVVGLAGGVSQFRIKNDDVNLVDAGDALGESALTQWYPEVSLGIFYSNRLLNGNYFYAGFSVPQIFSLNKTITSNFGSYQVEKRNHYAASAGYQKAIQENSYVEFSFRTMYLPDFPIFVDGNVKYQWNDFLSLEGGININGFAHMGFGFSPNIWKTKNRQLTFSASFELPVLADDLNPFGRRIEITTKWTQ